MNNCDVIYVVTSCMTGCVYITLTILTDVNWAEKSIDVIVLWVITFHHIAYTIAIVMSFTAL